MKRAVEKVSNRKSTPKVVMNGVVQEQAGGLMAIPQASEAFIRAYDQWAGALFRFAYFRVSSRELAQDLVSQAFLNAWQYVSRGGSVREWRSFLFRTIRNLVIDYYRVKHLSPQAITEMMERTLVAEGFLPEKRERAIEGHLILEAFAKLAPEQAELLELKFIEGLSAQEIAELTGKSSNAVYVSIHRALKRVREIL